MSSIDKFLNAKGQVKIWPKKSYDKDLVVGYLGAKFDATKVYSESEVNEIIKEWHAFDDWALLRRELVERHLMTRDKSGREYAITQDILDFRKPSSSVQQIIEFIKPGSNVLDIGTGEGRNIQLLLEQGAKVLAVDNDEKVLLETKKSHKDNLGEDLSIELKDITIDFPYGQYDLIICSMVLHFLNEEQSNEVIKNMQQSTRLNGLNVISMYSNENEPYIRNFMPDSSYLTTLYKGWEMIVDETDYSQWFRALDDYTYRRRRNRVLISRKKHKFLFKI